MDTLDPGEWDYIRSELDLRPNIKTPESYLNGVARGRELAMGLLAPRIRFSPCSLTQIRAVHFCLFHQVYVSAGEFREGEIEIGLGLASKPENIRTDLTTVYGWLERFFKSDDLKLQAEAIAAYHVALLQVHPFQDGNGRTARLITQCQMEKAFGPCKELAEDKRDYIKAVQKGDQEHDLKSLTGIIIGAANLGPKIELQSIDRKMSEGLQDLKAHPGSERGTTSSNVSQVQPKSQSHSR